MIIYMATNKVNGKRYVGKTKYSLSHRISGHKCYAFKRNSNSYFHKAIRKYGCKSFTWTTLCKCESEADTNTVERFFISVLDTTNRHAGYNLTKGGDGKCGYVPSQATRNKIGNANRGKVRTAECRRLLSTAHTGKNHYAYDPTMYVFIHDKYGEQECTRMKLQEHYGLRPASVLRVIRGLRRTHKGWRLKNSTMLERKGMNHPSVDRKRYKFSHPDHGKVKCSRYELYKEYQLNGAHVMEIVRGTRKTCKGWRLQEVA